MSFEQQDKLTAIETALLEQNAKVELALHLMTKGNVDPDLITHSRYHSNLIKSFEYGCDCVEKGESVTIADMMKYVSKCPIELYLPHKLFTITIEMVSLVMPYLRLRENV